MLTAIIKTKMRVIEVFTSQRRRALIFIAFLTLVTVSVSVFVFNSQNPPRESEISDIPIEEAEAPEFEGEHFQIQQRSNSPAALYDRDWEIYIQSPEGAEAEFISTETDSAPISGYVVVKSAEFRLEVQGTYTHMESASLAPPVGEFSNPNLSDGIIYRFKHKIGDEEGWLYTTNYTGQCSGTIQAMYCHSGGILDQWISIHCFAPEDAVSNCDEVVKTITVIGKYYFRGEYLKADIPNGWQVIEHENATGLASNQDDPASYSGITGLEIKSADEMTVLRLSGTLDVSTETLCQQTFELPDIEKVLEFKLFDKTFRLIDGKLYYDTTTGPSFDPSCGILENKVEIRDLIFVKRPASNNTKQESSFYTLSYDFSALSAKDLQKIKGILQSISLLEESIPLYRSVSDGWVPIEYRDPSFSPNFSISYPYAWEKSNEKKDNWDYIFNKDGQEIRIAFAVRQVNSLEEAAHEWINGFGPWERDYVLELLKSGEVSARSYMKYKVDGIGNDYYIAVISATNASNGTGIIALRGSLGTEEVLDEMISRFRFL